MIDDTLTILDEANTNVTLKVKTPHGMTPTINLAKVVAQGDLWSPIEASVHVDSIGKQMLKEEETGEAAILFKYKKGDHNSTPGSLR